MKAAILLTFCSILLMTNAAQAVYTEANAYSSSDSGDKPYSEASYTNSYGTEYMGIAEVESNFLKSLSNIELGSKYFYNEVDGLANAIAQTTIPLRVLSDGPISFDWSLTGEMRIAMVNPYVNYGSQLDTSYAVSIIDSLSSDSASSSDMLSVTDADPAGSYIVPVDLLEMYDFGGDSFSAGSIIDITLELQTDVAGTYGYYGTGTVVSSDFSDSLTIGNLDNLVIAPEPASIFLLLLGGIGLRKLRKR